jgi:hypothetical protein
MTGFPRSPYCTLMVSTVAIVGQYQQQAEPLAPLATDIESAETIAMEPYIFIHSYNLVTSLSTWNVSQTRDHALSSTSDCGQLAANVIPTNHVRGQRRSSAARY